MLPNDNSDKNRYIRETAKGDFEAARRNSFWNSVMAWFRLSRNELLPFDEVRTRLPLRGQHSIGLQQVPLEKVVGSVGRYHDFDRAFLPRRSHTKSRWISIDSARLQEVNLPPIEVYKISNVYFVKDGNHRVSVARANGQAFIDANVIEIDVPVAITPDMDIDDVIRLREEAEFIAQTELLDLRPEAHIELSIPAGYALLMEHIQTHRWFMGEEQKKEISMKEAVVDWYDNVYMPLVKVIRKNRIIERFWGRTETDLYVWIIEHLWLLRKDCCEDADIETAAEDFTRRFSPSFFQSTWFALERAAYALRDWLRGKKH